MTLEDVDYLKEKEPKRFKEYYYFVVEKIKAEIKENEKLKDKASGGSSESDTFKFRGEDVDMNFVSEVEEME